MAYVLKPGASLRREVQRVAAERLDDAIEALESVDDASSADIEEAVHDVRKRCKEVRALARLVRSSLGDEFDRCNALVRDAADVLSPIRDAHAILATLDELRSTQPARRAADLDRVRDALVEMADGATQGVHGGDDRIEEARALLVAARKRIKRWKVAPGFTALGNGLDTTYRRGRRALRRAEARPSDELMHEWRKSVKNLGYQVRLLERAAPSVLEPLGANLDDLAEALGDDHDLAVLVERLAARPGSVRRQPLRDPGDRHRPRPTGGTAAAGVPAGRHDLRREAGSVHCSRRAVLEQQRAPRPGVADRRHRRTGRRRTPGGGREART